MEEWTPVTLHANLTQPGCATTTDENEEKRKKKERERNVRERREMVARRE